VFANTAAETSEALEEPIMDSAILTTEVALEVIGVIGMYTKVPHRHSMSLGH
jgi:hypothetical protein